MSSYPIIGKIVTVDDLLPKVTELFRDTKHQHRLFHTLHRLTPVMSIVSICKVIWDVEQSSRATCVVSAPANFIDGGTLFHPQIFCVRVCVHVCYKNCIYMVIHYIYLTGVSAAQLQWWHLSDMNVIHKCRNIPYAKKKKKKLWTELTSPPQVFLYGLGMI